MSRWLLFSLVWFMLVSAACTTEIAQPEPTTDLTLAVATAVPTATLSPTLPATAAATAAITATATAVPIPSLPPMPLPPTPTPEHFAQTATGAIILFARDRDLWRVDLDGNEQQLSFGQLLPEDTSELWWNGPTVVSPDGRYLALWPSGSLIILDIFNPDQIRLVDAVAPTAIAWSPDSRQLAYLDPDAGRGLFVYDLTSGQSRPLFSDSQDGARIASLAWSPDARYLGFACCFLPADEQGQVRQIEISSGQMQTVGEIEATIDGEIPPLCWPTVGKLVANYDGQQCRPPGPNRYNVTSEYENFQAQLQPPLDDPDWQTGSLLVVTEIKSGAVAWQRLIAGPKPTLVYWLPGDSLIVGSRESGVESPILRVPAHGQGDLETIVAEGALLGLVQQWETQDQYGYISVPLAEPLATAEQAIATFLLYDQMMAEWERPWTAETLVNEPERITLRSFPNRSAQVMAAGGDDWVPDEMDVDLGMVWEITIQGRARVYMPSPVEGGDTTVYSSVTYVISARTGSLLSVSARDPIGNE